MIGKTAFLLCMLCLLSGLCVAQIIDSTRYHLNWKNTAIPAAVMIIGLTQVGHESQELQAEVKEDFPFFKSRLDDVAQYIPLAAVLLSGSLGFKPAHHFKARLMYSAISYATMGIAVNALKKTIHETRPDNSGDNSFPSGHTAFSFTGAEILHQEFKEQNPVLSYAGYPLAAGVGLYRMLNNKHYLSDVLVGAGLGILSAKLAYAIYHPKKNQLENKVNFSFYPTTILGRNGFSISAKF